MEQGPLKTIALVDDDNSYRKAMGRLLQAHGLKVQGFESPTEFLDRCQTDDFACCIFDVHMPDINGFELLSMMRDKGMKNPVVFVTAHELNESQSRIANENSCPVFSKPVSAPEILAAIARACKKAEPS